MKTSKTKFDRSSDDGELTKKVSDGIRFWKFIGIGWLSFFAWSWAPSFLPPSYWFQVHSIMISDSFIGNPIEVDYDRTINNAFKGSYIVTVRKKVNSGGFYTYCKANDDVDYRLDNELPDFVSLKWYTYPTECELTAGTYRVDTLWEINLPRGAKKQVRKRSNVFQVYGWNKGLE